MIRVFLSGILFSLQAWAAASPDFSPYHEITRHKLGEDGAWDYLTMDPSAKRLYIARFNRIMVVDSDTGKLVGQIPGVEGAHGVALVPKLGLGFATAGKSGSVIVFNAKSLKPMGQIKVGENPDALLFDPKTERLFVFNGKSKDLSVVDPASQKVVKTIALDGKPEFAVSDESGKVFVNLEDKSTLVVLDALALNIVKKYPLKPCVEPSGLAMDLSKRRLFVGCDNKMALVVDADSGKILKTLPVGEGVDACAFDPQKKLAFVSAGEGRLTVIRESSGGYEVAQDLNTQKGARTLAVDAKSGKVFLATAQFGPPEALKPGQTKARPSIVPGTFAVLVIGQ